jgi:hypothetical protein
MSKRRKLTYAEAGALGGASTSPAKRRAARKNAQAGGRPPIWQCPRCETTGSGGDTARPRLQVTYRLGKVEKIICRVCGARGLPPFDGWLVGDTP